MIKRPKCNAPLSISIELEIDYTKAQAIPEAKATDSDLTNEELASLNWNSKNRRFDL